MFRFIGRLQTVVRKNLSPERDACDLGVKLGKNCRLIAAADPWP